MMTLRQAGGEKALNAKVTIGVMVILQGSNGENGFMLFKINSSG